MTDTFPRQYARTQRFTLGVPRSFQISPDGNRVVFLRSKSGSDPVTCLWLLDVTTGREHLIADPAELGKLGSDDGDLDPAEQARRERSREQAAGIVAFGCDDDVRLAVFGLSGRVYAADLAMPGTAGHDSTPDPAAGRAAMISAVPALAPAADPRPDPAGRLVAYACAGGLRIISLDSGEDRAIASADAESAAGTGGAAGNISFGLAEFIAAEEMGRARGYWWAPDSAALLVARVDVGPVQRLHIADPSNPGQPATEIRYPAAGTPNAVVSLVLAGLDGRHTPVSWDNTAFPYLVTACWAGAGSAAGARSASADAPSHRGASPRPARDAAASGGSADRRHDGTARGQ